MNPHKEGEPQTLEVQKTEPLTINRVLDSVYEKLVSGFEETPLIRQFDNQWFQWDSFHDLTGTRCIYFHLTGVLFELEKNKGLLIVKSDETEPSWFSSLTKVVAWNRLEIGGDSKYKLRLKDYPTWDEIPTERMIFELPKDIRESSVKRGYGGILANRGQRLALNGVIPMQPKFVAKKEAVDPGLVRGPGGVPILLDEPRRKADRMYVEDIVTSGTLYEPLVVPYLVEKIRKDLTRKHPRRYSHR